MKKLDGINEDTEIDCPECGQPMKQEMFKAKEFFPACTYYDLLMLNRLYFVCKNEKCKFIGIPRLVKYLLSDKWWGKEE